MIRFAFLGPQQLEWLRESDIRTLVGKVIFMLYSDFDVESKKAHVANFKTFEQNARVTD